MRATGILKSQSTAGTGKAYSAGQQVYTYNSIPVLYRKIPKKLHARLQACPQKGSAVGWGIQFVEGLDLFVVFVIGCVGFAAALVVALAWSIMRQDLQSGFAMAGFM